jgi:hypothetical protein
MVVSPMPRTLHLESAEGRRRRSNDKQHRRRSHFAYPLGRFFWKLAWREKENKHQNLVLGRRRSWLTGQICSRRSCPTCGRALAQLAGVAGFVTGPQLRAWPLLPLDHFALTLCAFWRARSKRLDPAIASFPTSADAVQAIPKSVT